LHGSTKLQIAEADGYHQLFEKRESKDCDVLLLAKNEVLEPSANTSADFGEVTEPLLIIFDKLRDGGVSIWASHSVCAARLKAAKDVSEVTLKIRKVFNNVMRVNRGGRVAVERQGISQISPNVTLGSERICVDVDPPVKVIPLTGPKMNFYRRISWCAEPSIK
jgi:hypothetical protein